MPKYTGKELKQLVILKDLYHQCFHNQPIAEEHTQIPRAFNVITSEEAFLIFSKQKVGTLEFELNQTILDKKTDSDKSESMNSSPLNLLTNDLLTRSKLYFENRQKSFIRRPSNINDPFYILIYVICSRLKKLCVASITSTLIAEYECLDHFISKIIERYEDFPTLSASGFHRYLNDLSRGVSLLKSRTQFFCEMTSVSCRLQTMTNKLGSYQESLACYLAYAITDVPLPKVLSLSILKGHGTDLILEFSKTKIFKNICSALNKGNLLLITLNNPSTGVAGQFFDKQSTPNVLLCHHKLMTLLSRLEEICSIFTKLSSAAKLEGELKIVHDRDLRYFMDISMAFIYHVFATVNSNIEYISQETEKSLNEKIVFKPGFSNNKVQAKEQFNCLKRIANETIAVTKQIKESIDVIKQLTPEDIAEQHNDLLNHVSRLIFWFKKEFQISDQALPTERVEKEEMVNSAASSESKIQTRFPIICSLLAHSEPLSLEFQKNILRIDQEVQITASDFIDQVSRINQKSTEIKQAITLCKSAALAEAKILWPKIKKEYAYLEEMLQKTRYHEYTFQSFSFLNRFLDGMFRSKTEKSVTAIRQVTHQLSNADDNKRVAIEVEMMCDLAKLNEGLVTKVNDLSHVVCIDITSEQPLVEHFQQSIDDLKKDILSSISYSELCDDALLASTASRLKSSLQFLQVKLQGEHYRLWGGGTEISAQNAHKVPHHIKAILNELEQIKTSTHLEDLINIREKVFATARHAAAHPPVYACFFKPRTQATQDIYNAFVNSKQAVADDTLSTLNQRLAA